MKKKRKKKVNKGFTLVEILVTVTILGILTAIAITSVSNVIEKSKAKHYMVAEKQMKNAGQEYIRNNRNELPKLIGEKNKIYLRKLVDKRYIEVIKDYSDNKCDLDKSYVQVYKYSKNNYSYFSHLVCNKYDTSEQNPEKPIINIKFDLPSNKKYITKFEIKDKNTLVSYSYVIYRYGEEKYNSGNIALNPKDLTKSINKTKEIAALTPGKIRVVVTATNILGNTTMESLTKDFADNKPPKCIINPEDSKPKEWEQINKRVITVGCDDEEGSGCKREKYTKEFVGTQDYGYITISDKAGNKTNCKVSVFIDQTPPTCVSSGGSELWKNKDITITGTCSDKGSGCKEPKISKTFTSNINSNESPGYLEDKVGNKIYCPSQRVKLDKVKPTMPKLSNTSNSRWINQNVIISGEARDDFSGIKKVFYEYEDKKERTDWDEKNNYNSSYIFKGIWSAERNNHVNVVVEDNAGNKSVYDAGYVKIDTTKPTISYKKSRDKWTTSGEFTITTTANDNSSPIANSGIENIYYNIGNGNKTSWDKNDKHVASKTWYTEMANEIKVLAVDRAGNYSQTLSAGHVLIDTTAPKCTSSGGSDSWRNKDFTIYGHCSDPNGSGCKQSTIQKNITTDIQSNESPGYVYDNAGNKTWCPNQVVKLDKTIPYISNVSLEGFNAWTNGYAKMYVSSDDGNSNGKSGIKKMYYTFDKVNYYDNWNTGIPKYYGEQTFNQAMNKKVWVIAEDNAGNKSEHKEIGQVMIDRSAPTCSITASTAADSNNQYSKKTIFKLEKSDDNQIESFGIKSVEGVEYNGIEELGPLDAGNHTIYGYVKDLAGNVGNCSLNASVKSQYRCDKGTLDKDKCIVKSEYKTVSEYQHIWYCVKPGGLTCPNPPGTKDKWEWVDVQKYVCPDGFQHLDGHDKNERCWKAAISE